MADQRTEKILDTTRRLEWVVTKEMYESCVLDKWINSGTYNVEIGGQSSKWVLHLKRGTESNKIYLKFRRGDVKVEIKNIGIKSEVNDWPCEPIHQYLDTNIPMSKIVHLNDQVNYPHFCRTQAGDEKTFLDKFIKNKIIVVADLRFYVHAEIEDRNAYTEKNEMEKNFLSSMRSISDLDTLADFTIICEGREFRCHRNILASMSTVFRAMILSLQFVENNENSVSIEDSTPDIVEAMLEFMAKGVVPRDIEEKAIDLIALADKYDLQDLIKVCENSLADNITVENVIQTLIAIDLHVPHSQHRQKIVDFVKAEGEQVVKSRDWNKFIEKYPNLVTEIFLSLVREPRSTAGN